MAGVQHRRWAVADRPWAGHHALNGKTWMAGTSLDHDVEDHDVENRDVQCAFRYSQTTKLSAGLPL